MAIVTTSEIVRFYTNKLPKATLQEIKSFLKKVAETLKDAEEYKVESELIQEVSELIRLMRKAVISDKSSREMELQYAEVKGLAQALKRAAEKEKFDRIFYKDVYELGMLLDDFTRFIKIVLPIIVSLKESGILN